MGGTSQSTSVIESEDVEEDQEARDQCQTEEARSKQGETVEQTHVEDQVEDRTFHHQHGDGRQGTGDNANQEVRDLTVQGGREVPSQDGVNETKIEKHFSGM